MSELSDLDLVARAAASSADPMAFELLVRRHTDSVWRVCFGMLRDRHSAEEATQETFLKAFRGLGAFRGESSVRTWLASIATRVCIDAMRRPQAEIVSLDEAREDRSRQADAATSAALSLAIETLTDEQRQAFLLVDVLGLSREEAASAAGIASSTLKSRLTAAHKRLVGELSGSTSTKKPARGDRR